MTLEEQAYAFKLEDLEVNTFYLLDGCLYLKLNNTSSLDVGSDYVAEHESASIIEPVSIVHVVVSKIGYDRAEQGDDLSMTAVEDGQCYTL